MKEKAMHECPDCREYCDCDGEDHDQPAPDDCRHNCPPEIDDNFDDEPADDDMAADSGALGGAA